MIVERPEREVFEKYFHRGWTPRRVSEALAAILTIGESMRERELWLRHLMEALRAPIWVQVCGKATLLWQEDDAGTHDREKIEEAIIRLNLQRMDHLIDRYDGGDAGYTLGVVEGRERGDPGLVRVNGFQGSELHLVSGKVVDLHLAIVALEESQAQQAQEESA